MRGMKMGKILSKIAILIVAMSVIAFTQIVSAERQIIDLGTLPGGFNSTANGINDYGQIVGASDSNAFIWRDGSMTDLGTLSGENFTSATSINDLGQIVGNSAIFGNVCCQAVLLQNGEWVPLGTLPVDIYSKAACINDSGQIVGESANSQVLRHALIWQDSLITSLGTLGGTGHSFAYANNNNGQVVGGASTSDGFYHAFLWQDGMMTDLGTLGGSYSYATGINNLGQIVGYSQTSNGSTHAFLWQDGAMMDLGTIGEPPYPGSSYANGINDAGKVVGYSSTFTPGVTHAFLWQNSIMTDLGSLGGNFSFAAAINNVGQVVGYSNLPSGYSHAVLWTEEPLMITATAGSGGSISPSGNVIVYYGESQSFSIIPDKYYRILDVIVDGVSVDSLKQYTFENVTTDHIITATFALTNIGVESPNGGEALAVGTVQDISWTYIDNPGNVISIELLKGGTLFKTINPGVAIGKSGGGSYKWHIQSKLPLGNDYQIRISSKDNNDFSDTSDNFFSIQ
jgi:probable HAF family extracellular repeat protein